VDSVLKVAIPSSDYHKRFSSQLIHGFIQMARQVCKHAGIECFEKDQQEFKSLLDSDKKPFDILISMGFTSLTPDLAKFYKHHNIKVILFQDDIHGKDEKDFKKKKKWIQFADLLLIPYYENFLSREEYTNCHSKAIEFPWFAPRACFNHKTKWNQRNNNILVSGCMAAVYSLRRNLRTFSRSVNYVEILDHPGYRPGKRKHNIIGDAYYSLLSDHKCAVATSADPPLDYPLSKYFEIPACGCLGLFEEIGALANLGFEKNKHYIPITNEDFRDVAKHAHKNINKYENMATTCKEHVRRYHTDVVRACSLVDILNNF